MKKILIVDDEKAMLEILSILLKRSGNEVVEAENGKLACEFIENGKFDLIITDISMPELDGLGLLKKLKNSKSKIPVILMTGISNLLETIDAYKLGASVFLSKPFTKEELTKAIDHAFNPKEEEVEGSPSHEYCPIRIEDF